MNCSPTDVCVQVECQFGILNAFFFPGSLIKLYLCARSPGGRGGGAGGERESILKHHAGG